MMTTTQNKSTTHARNRVTGPASSSEKTIPSGVRMTRVLVFTLRSSLREKQRQQHEFDAAEPDFHGVGDHRLVVLRQKRFNDTGPNEQYRDSEDQRDQITRNSAQPCPQRVAVAPT